MSKRSSGLYWLAPALVLALLAFRLLIDRSPEDQPALIMYSGRSEDLIQPLVTRFEAETGMRISVRYGQTAEMAATILEEGSRSPADIFLAQDAGALGALAHADRFVQLEPDLLDLVDHRFRSPSGHWIGISGRARVVVFNPDRITEEDLPTNLDGFCAPEWRGRVGWAPQNGSFQAFVTALRVTRGFEYTRNWLACMAANGTRSFSRNTSIVMAVAAGEIDAGLVNHYYVHAIQQDRAAPLTAANFFPDNDILINVAGVGILSSSQKQREAATFIRYLLSESAQHYFTAQTYEYPLLRSHPTNPLLPPLDTLSSPELDLGDLDDLDGTLRLLQELGIL